ncbi:MAG: beta-ketoacyl-ACP synthase III [Pseudomonadota bacterium]
METSKVYLAGTGLFTPPYSISNEELVASFNQYVELENIANAAEIESGALEAKQPSSVEFIEKASGIKARYVWNKEGVLDPSRMTPAIADRANDEPSVMCEMAISAAREALDRAGRKPEDIDAVICAASNMQRPYPAMAIEVQAALGIGGYAFDMNVACSSATFGLQQARDAIRAGSAKNVLVVNPEICTGHLNFCDRDSHFIFGDVCTAFVCSSAEAATGSSFEVVDSQLYTEFSNNIRNNFGFLNRGDESGVGKADKLFIQEGRKVFKEVCPAVANLIAGQLEALSITPKDIRRFWLHQANLNMNVLIAKRVLGRGQALW